MWWIRWPRAASASTPSASALLRGRSSAPGALHARAPGRDTLKRIAEATDGAYFNASTETDLQTIYENLSTHMVFRKQETEITAFFTGLAIVLLLLAGTLSLLWFNRLP